MSLKKELFKTIKEKGLVFNHQKPIRNSNGSQGRWLFDLKSLFLHPPSLKAIAELFWAHYKNQYPFQVGGLEITALPLITAIQMEGLKHKREINGFILRKERKEKGLCNQVEGSFNKEKIIIVDDLINSGSSLEKCRVICAEEKKSITHFFSVLDFQHPRSDQLCAQHKISKHALYLLEEFDLKLTPPKTIPPSDLTLKWVFSPPLPANYFYTVPKSAPCFDDKKVYFGTDHGTFYALDKETGKKVWKYETGDHEKGIFSSPIFYKNTVYFGGYDGNFYALNTETGKPNWIFTESDFIGSSPTLAPKLNLVFIGLEHQIPGKKGSFAAINMETGEKIWEWMVQEYLHGSPLFIPEKEIVVIGTNDATVLAFTAKTGRLLWTHQCQGQVKYAPAYDSKRNQVCFGSHDHHFYGIDLDTGQTNFVLKTDNIIYSSPLVIDDFAYIGSNDKNMYVVDLTTSKIHKKYKTHGKIYSSPTLYKDEIYFGSNDGILRKINPQTQECHPQLQFPDRITNRIVADEKSNLLYVGTYDNQLFAFEN